MRIFFIGGMSTVVNHPCTLECILYRSGRCTHNNTHYMCFELEDWNNKTEKEQDELIIKQFDKARVVCLQEGRVLVMRQA